MKKAVLFLVCGLFLISLVSAELPSEFDWRNYNGQNWLSPVKNQGLCGACWAFASVGVTEAGINLNRNDSNFDLDLSEQHLISNYSDAGDCNGGGGGYAVIDIRDKGIVDEECFLYKSQNSNMDDICGGANSDEWKNRLWNIKGFEGIIGTNREGIKQALIQYGPSDYGMRMTGHFDENEIYRDCQKISGFGHEVVLVGYNDEGNYWILKNSWGVDWMDNGYFKADYDTCAPKSVGYITFNEEELNQRIPDIVYENKTSEIEYKDENRIFIEEEFDAEVIFELSKISRSEKMYLILNQAKAGNVNLNISYCDNEKNFSIQSNEKIAKYDICKNAEECNEIKNCNLTLKYRGEENSNLSLDWIILESVPFPCEPNIINSSWSEWFDDGNCLINNTKKQIRTMREYDENSCGTFEEIVYTEERFVECDYCSYSVINETSDWENNGKCVGDIQFQKRNITEYDENYFSCYAITGLESDLWNNGENNTYIETREIGCGEYCFSDSECSDGVYCNGVEKCINHTCENSALIDCSANNLPFISSCTYDSNPFTLEYSDIFTSVCSEIGKSCTSKKISSSCDFGCGAECEKDSDCSDGKSCYNCSCSDVIKFKFGWNAVSFLNSDISVNDLKNYCAISSVQYFENGEYKTETGNLSSGKGYWIYSAGKNDCNFPTEFNYEPEELEINSEWNFVGSFLEEKELIDLGCEISTPAWYWTGRYFKATEKLIPSQAHWIYAKEDCTQRNKISPPLEFLR